MKPYSREKRIEIYKKARNENRELSVEEKIDICIANVDLDTPIYRIFKWKHFKRDLEKNTLTLTCVSQWCRMEQYEAFPFKKTEWEKIRNSYHGLSFSLNGTNYVKIEGRKFLIWDIYDEIHNGSNSEGNEPQVRIATTVGDLMRAIFQNGKEDFYIKVGLGRVVYTNDLAKPSYSLFCLGSALGVGNEILFKKQVECSWEHEVRLIYHSEESGKCSLTLNVPFSKLFRHVQFSPKLGDAQREEFTKTLVDYGFNKEQIVEEIPNTQEIEPEDTYGLSCLEAQSKFHQGSPNAKVWSEDLCKSSMGKTSEMSEK